MIVYSVRNKSNNYEILKEFKTKEAAKEFIKGLKEFDSRHNSPFNDIYEIWKEC